MEKVTGLRAYDPSEIKFSLVFEEGREYIPYGFVGNTKIYYVNGQLRFGLQFTSQSVSDLLDRTGEFCEVKLEDSGTTQGLTEYFNGFFGVLTLVSADVCGSEIGTVVFGIEK